MEGPSMLQIYRNACTALGWSPRALIEEAMKRLDDGINPLIVKLPTGYGKTSITLSMGVACRESSTNWLRVLHVLPMRSIVDDVEFRLKNQLQGLGLTNLRVYKQYMGSPGSPFYCGRGIITTTLDTFMMNLFKVPASEFRKLVELGYSHYDIPRANIYSSAVVLDEFHLLSGIGALDEELKSLASTLAAIRALCEVGVPLVISTATLPEVLVEAIRSILKRVGIDVREQHVLRWSDLKDLDFERSRGSTRISLEVIHEHEIASLLEKNSKKRILLVMNKVERAVRMFREICQNLGVGPQVTLLHGRLREDVKKERIKEIDSAQILVATQVIEAGVDKSFDVLITDPCPLDRFVQRAGRVARAKGSTEGSIYVIELENDEPYSGIYSEELTIDSMKALERFTGETFGKLEFEEALIGEMEEVYRRHVDQDSIMSRVRLRALIDLDEQPILGREDAKNALIELEGFTDSFGIIAVFDASEVSKEFSYDFSVGVSENIAKKILESKRMVVVKDQSKIDISVYIEKIMADLGEFKVVGLRDELIKKILSDREPFTISLLKHGVEGIAVDKIDPMEGLVWM